MSRRALLLTPGEPAGIGPDLCLALAVDGALDGVVVVASLALLHARAAHLGLDVTLHPWQPGDNTPPARAGELWVWPHTEGGSAPPGQLQAHNAGYVLSTLRSACDAVAAGTARALITGPVQKSVLADSGEPFMGHTEWLATRLGAPVPVMMLLAGDLRVALVTTHLPLREVADAITPAALSHALRVLHRALQDWFKLPQPRIVVAGLNPHAGENGHLGEEEITIISPVLNQLRAQGMQLVGPLPADTLFTPRHLRDADAVLAMYHDQGLPVLKHAGFGQAVNLTLGLPIIRTSVDHGVALDLAGSGKAESGSLRAAIALADQLSRP